MMFSNSLQAIQTKIKAVQTWVKGVFGRFTGVFYYGVCLHGLSFFWAALAIELMWLSIFLCIYIFTFNTLWNAMASKPVAAS